MSDTLGIDEHWPPVNVRAAAHAIIIHGLAGQSEASELTSEQFTAQLIQLWQTNHEELIELGADQSPPPPAVEIMLLDYILREFELTSFRKGTKEYEERHVIEDAMLLAPHR